MQPLVLLALAALQAALVGALQLPVGVVVDALPRLGLAAPGTCARGRELLPSSPRPTREAGCQTDSQMHSGGLLGGRGAASLQQQQ